MCSTITEWWYCWGRGRVITGLKYRRKVKRDSNILFLEPSLLLQCCSLHKHLLNVTHVFMPFPMYYTSQYNFKIILPSHYILLNGTTKIILTYFMPIMKFLKNSFFTHSTNNCCSIAKLCPILCDPIGLQQVRLPCPSLSTRVCSISCPSSLWCHPTILSSVTLFSSFLSLSQHQSLFQWVDSSHQVAKILELQFQYQSFQWIFRVDFF